MQAAVEEAGGGDRADARDALDPVGRISGQAGPAAPGAGCGRAWWVRSHAKPSADFDVIEAGWNDWYLTDVDRSGTRILTTSVDGPILVRSFPGLDVIRTIEPPAEDHQWGDMACFADDLIITTVIDFRTGDETRGAIDPAGTSHPWTAATNWSG